MPEHVLIVDDEPDIEFLILQRFRKQIKDGLLTFSFASNGREALEKLAKDPSLGIVMTDINMPEMDGLTLLERVKELKHSPTVVVVSAYGDLSNIRTAMNRGAFDFLIKPIDFNDFETTLLKTIKEYHSIQELVETRVHLEEEKIERHKAENKEKVKQQFLANMSHEIRTPMNAILGMTNLLLKSPSPEKQKYYLESVKQSAENLLIIINDVLDLSKLEAGKMELEKIPFSIKEQVKQVYDIMHFKAEEKGLILSTSIASDVPENLIGDPARLNQILINLLGNAIKFTEKGGVQLIVEKKQDNSIQFKIKDSGIGMNAEQLSKIFSSFTQAESSISRKFGGTGLGLSISKTLVELHGGNIEVTSNPGVGSEFTFAIPYPTSDGKKTTNNIIESTDDYSHLAKLKILLAEDNEFNQIVLVDTLEHLLPGIKIDTVSNGKEAVNNLEKNDYDLILMDVQMPEMNGYEATKHIRTNLNESKKSIPVIALTAAVIKSEIDLCYEAGMNDYIPKPFQNEELLGALFRIAGKKPTA